MPYLNSYAYLCVLLHIHAHSLPYDNCRNAGQNDDKSIERCQNDDETVLDMDVPKVSLKLVFRAETCVPGRGAAAASLDIFHFGILHLHCRAAARPGFGQSRRHRAAPFSHLQRLPGNNPIPYQGRQASRFNKHDPQRKEAISKQEPNLRSGQRRIFEAIPKALLTNQPVHGH